MRVTEFLKRFKSEYEKQGKTARLQTGIGGGNGNSSGKKPMGIAMKSFEIEGANNITHMNNNNNQNRQYTYSYEKDRSNIMLDFTNKPASNLMPFQTGDEQDFFASAEEESKKNKNFIKSPLAFIQDVRTIIYFHLFHNSLPSTSFLDLNHSNDTVVYLSINLE